MHIDPLPLPCYAVVFTSVRTGDDPEGYEAMADKMVELSSRQPGFLGIESARGADGVGITVSYWDSLQAIERWRADAEHRVAQQLGRQRWYRAFRLAVCRVEREQVFASPQPKE
jgi:heme-degrading monooxygenase HmoA